MSAGTQRRTTTAAAAGSLPLEWVANLGRGVRRASRQLAATLRLALLVIGLSLERGTWRRTVREEFLLHAHRIAVGGVPAVTGTAAIIGLAIALQIFVWMAIVGDIAIVARVLMLSLVREIAPLFTAFIVIGRSATVIAVMLGRMTLGEQMRSLEALGIDPIRLLVVPRVLALSIGCFVLTVVFICVALAMGYVAAVIGGIDDVSPTRFLVEIVDTMGPGEFVAVVTKPLVTGFAAGVVTCSIGISPRIAAGDVPMILPRAFVLGSLTVLVISVGMSLII